MVERFRIRIGVSLRVRHHFSDAMIFFQRQTDPEIERQGIRNAVPPVNSERLIRQPADQLIGQISKRPGVVSVALPRSPRWRLRFESPDDGRVILGLCRGIEGT